MSANDEIRIGFQARLFSGQRTAIQEVEFGVKSGFRAIQFRGHVGLAKRTNFGERRELATCLRANDVEPTMELLIEVGADALTEDRRSPVEVLESNLSIIDELGIKCVHWHLYSLIPDDSDMQALHHLLLDPCFQGTRIAQSHGFVLGIENNPPEGRILYSPSECLEFLDQIPELRLVWDMNHSPSEFHLEFHSLGARTSLLHISDTPLPDLNHHLPIGEGSIDVAQHLRTMVANGFRGPAILEIGGPPGSGSYRDTDSALAESRSRLESFLF